jgi:hypothetical protein
MNVTRANLLEMYLTNGLDAVQQLTHGHWQRVFTVATTSCLQPTRSTDEGTFWVVSVSGVLGCWSRPLVPAMHPDIRRGKKSCSSCPQTVPDCLSTPVQILFELCRFRNAHPAFNGTFSLLDTISDIRESVIFVPCDSGSVAPSGPLKPGLSASLESQDRVLKDSGVGGGAFRAQSAGNFGESGGTRDFLTDVVGASVDILASLDGQDELRETWCVLPPRLLPCRLLFSL